MTASPPSARRLPKSDTTASTHPATLRRRYDCMKPHRPFHRQYRNSSATWPPSHISVQPENWALDPTVETLRLVEIISAGLAIGRGGNHWGSHSFTEVRGSKIVEIPQYLYSYVMEFRWQSPLIWFHAYFDFRFQQWRPMPLSSFTATAPANSSQRRSSVPCSGYRDAGDLVSGKSFNREPANSLASPLANLFSGPFS